MPIRIGTPVPPSSPPRDPSPKPRPDAAAPLSAPAREPERAPKPEAKPEAQHISDAQRASAAQPDAAPRHARGPDPAERPRPAPKPSGSARPGIDPRIKQRRIKVQRAEGRRRLRVLLIAAGVLAVVLLAAALTRSPLMNVDRVVVTGATHTGHDQVVAAAGLEHHPAMLDVNTGAVARRVAGLPWVERATASRQWLGTVRITVVERTAVAVVAGPDNGWALVDLRGHVVDISGIRPIELPVIEGVEPAGPRGSIVSARSQAALQVAAALPPDLKTRTDAVVAAGEETQLRLVPTGTVRLGDESRLPDKLQAVLTVLGSVDPKVVKVLDVRVPRAPVLTRR